MSDTASAPAQTTGIHGSEVQSPYRATARPKRVRVPHLRELKERGEKWPMLTAYDYYTAEIFDEAGIPVLLVGDSAGNNVLGYENTIPVTVDELVPMVKAVVRGATSALVVADLPFGSYQVSVEQAVTTAIRFMKEGAHAVKLEGGAHFAPHVRAIVAAGIPVMGHIGFTPQSEHALGGFRIQGRSADAADAMIADALALQQAGAFAVVLEMVPALVAKRITAEVEIPTIGIGAGPDTDAQVLVWQDMMGMNRGRTPRFVKQYADVGSVLVEAARRFGDEVRGSVYPDSVHSYD